MLSGSLSSPDLVYIWVPWVVISSRSGKLTHTPALTAKWRDCNGIRSQLVFRPSSICKHTTTTTLQYSTWFWHAHRLVMFRRDLEKTPDNVKDQA